MSCGLPLTSSNNDEIVRFVSTPRSAKRFANNFSFGKDASHKADLVSLGLFAYFGTLIILPHVVVYVSSLRDIPDLTHFSFCIQSKVSWSKSWRVRALFDRLSSSLLMTGSM